MCGFEYVIQFNSFQFSSVLFVFICQSHNMHIIEYTKDVVKIHGRCGCHYKCTQACG